MWDASKTNSFWSSGTSGHNGACLDLQVDGNLVIYDVSGTVWASNSQSNCSGDNNFTTFFNTICETSDEIDGR